MISESIETASKMSWAPFQICESGTHPPRTRSIRTREGIGDRLRTAAFAEIQARDAFLWGVTRWQGEAPEGLLRAWRGLAIAEQRHLDWLLRRMKELDIDVAERPVSDQLWTSLVNCPNAQTFAEFMASAEERGRLAGERFYEAMKEVDPISAEIFRKIADEEVAHIEVAFRFYGYRPSHLSIR